MEEDLHESSLGAFHAPNVIPTSTTPLHDGFSQNSAPSATWQFDQRPVWNGNGPAESSDWPPLNRPPKVDFYLVATTGRGHPCPSPDPKGIWKKTRRSYQYPPNAQPLPSQGVDQIFAGSSFAEGFPAAGTTRIERCDGSTPYGFGPPPTVVPAALTLSWCREEIPSLSDQAVRFATMGEGCYGCGCLSHSQNNCPLRKCGRCSSYGHSEKACQGSTSSTAYRPNVGYDRSLERRRGDRDDRGDFSRGGDRNWVGGGGSSSLRDQRGRYDGTGGSFQKRGNDRNHDSDSRIVTGRADVCDWRGSNQRVVRTRT